MRLVSVYSSKSLTRWWTKAWFNNNDVGEWAVEIEYKIAVNFILNSISKEEMLETYYPEQMKIYHSAIEKTKRQLLSGQIQY